ncbi:MAG: winged helix-turn-helix transcriptional regulator [Candidatus Omnitrophica bacterium]|nr:winged helix-turn-helix transcriptional regulator [Candidatus Omnitrophota bacterium]
MRTFNRSTAVLKAAANVRRLEIICLLLRNKELSVSDIADKVRLSLKSTSKHLQKLEQVGFIERKQRSRWGFYQICYSQMGFVKALLELIGKKVC